MSGTPDHPSRSLLIQGHFPDSSFIPWIVRRARKLDLFGWVRQYNPSTIEIQMQGDPVLLDAMEVACQLGPVQMNVEFVDVKEINLSEEVYRQPRRFVGYSEGGEVLRI